MKISKYNHVFNHPTDDQKKVMCNYRTTALAIINPPQYEQYKLLCEDCNLQLENQLKKQLLEGGFILEDNIDEQTIMEVDMLRWRYATGNLTLTLAPTMNCNFRCIYCYEKDSIRDSMMQPDIQQAILDFISSKAPTISGLNITWYGGEPLLAWEIIKDLTHKMQQICKDNQINYSASMVTNGYLMTEDMAKELESLNIKSIQITLDGPKIIHDQRRILVNGKGTFDRIIENIKYLVNYIHVNVRVNIDNSNVSTLENDLYAVLLENGILDKVHICFGYVDSINGAYAVEKCLSMETYSQKHLEFLEHNDMNIMDLYPHPIDNYCGADSTSTYVIGPEGNLYKCWSDIGIEEKRVGNVMNGESEVIHNKLSLDYLNYSPLNDDLCKDCEVLPLCKGGCPNKRLANQNRCSEHKFVIDKYFKTCIDTLVKKQNG